MVAIAADGHGVVVATRACTDPMSGKIERIAGDGTATRIEIPSGNLTVIDGRAWVALSKQGDSLRGDRADVSARPFANRKRGGLAVAVAMGDGNGTVSYAHISHRDSWGLPRSVWLERVMRQRQKAVSGQPDSYRPGGSRHRELNRPVASNSTSSAVASGKVRSSSLPGVPAYFARTRRPRCELDMDTGIRSPPRCTRARSGMPLGSSRSSWRFLARVPVRAVLRSSL